MEKNILEEQNGNSYSPEAIKTNPEVIIFYEAWNYDNRSYGTIKAKGYTALTAEVHKEKLKLAILELRS